MISTNVSQTNNTILQRKLDIMTHKYNQAVQQIEDSEANATKYKMALNSYINTFTRKEIEDKKGTERVYSLEEIALWQKQVLKVNSLSIQFKQDNTNTSIVDLYLIITLSEPFEYSASSTTKQLTEIKVEVSHYQGSATKLSDYLSEMFILTDFSMGVFEKAPIESTTIDEVYYGKYMNNNKDSMNSITNYSLGIITKIPKNNIDTDTTVYITIPASDPNGSSVITPYFNDRFYLTVEPTI